MHLEISNRESCFAVSSRKLSAIMQGMNVLSIFLVFNLGISTIVSSPLPSSAVEKDSIESSKKIANGLVPTEVVEGSPEGCFVILRSSCVGVYLQRSPGARPETCGTKEFHDCLASALSTNKKCRQSRLAMNIMMEFLHHFEAAYLIPKLCPSDTEQEEIIDLFSYNEEPFLHEDEEHHNTLPPPIELHKVKEKPTHLLDEDKSDPFIDQGYVSSIKEVKDVDEHAADHVWDTIDEESKDDHHADELFRADHEPEYEALPYGDYGTKEHDRDEMGSKMEPMLLVKESTVAPLDRTHPTNNQQIETVEVYVDETGKKTGDKMPPWWENQERAHKKGFEPIREKIGSLPMGRFNVGIHDKREIRTEYFG